MRLVPLKFWKRLDCVELMKFKVKKKNSFVNSFSKQQLLREKSLKSSLGWFDLWNLKKKVKQKFEISQNIKLRVEFYHRKFPI